MEPAAGDRRDCGRAFACAGGIGFSSGGQCVIEKRRRTGDSAVLPGTGLEGVLFLVLLQMVQVITSLIPALSLQAAAGASYGPLFGSLVILAGMVLGNGLVYLLAEKLLGQLSPESKISRSLGRFHHWLAGKNKELYCFLMFLLPILPNVVKPYLAAVSDVRWSVFLFCCGAGSIIPVLAGTLIGNFLIEGRTREALIVAIAAVIASILAALIQKRRSAQTTD